MRRRTREDGHPAVLISIHASRMGCDRRSSVRRTLCRDFNPRIPYGMRRHGNLHRIIGCRFQSTHPVWDATGTPGAPGALGVDFNPRIPYGMRPPSSWPERPWAYFNPRIPYGMRLREWTLHSIIWKLLPALRADYIADIPEHLSVCIFGL